MHLRAQVSDGWALLHQADRLSRWGCTAWVAPRGDADCQPERKACAQTPQRLGDMPRKTGALFSTQCRRHKAGA